MNTEISVLNTEMLSNTEYMNTQTRILIINTLTGFGNIWDWEI